MYSGIADRLLDNSSRPLRFRARQVIELQLSFISLGNDILCESAAEREINFLLERNRRFVPSRTYIRQHLYTNFLKFIFVLLSQTNTVLVFHSLAKTFHHFRELFRTRTTPQTSLFLVFFLVIVVVTTQCCKNIINSDRSVK